MKILIVSDTHRKKNENYMKVLQKDRQVDLVIHLGISRSEYTIQEAAGCPGDGCGK